MTPHGTRNTEHEHTLTVGSVCSGIGGIDLGFVRQGYRLLWTCERDPQASAVLAARFPGTPHYDDLTHDSILDAPAPDVLTGGTPCQGFSLAGLRRGLADERSNLCLRFVALAARFSGATVLWENVPGVLSQPDNAFGTFLAGLVGADDALLPSSRPQSGEPAGRYWRKDKAGDCWVPKWPSAGVVSGPLRTAAWKCLDAQYLGVAQRRNRVLVIADPGDGSAPQILFEPEGLRRDTPPRRGARQDIAGGFECGPSGGRLTDLAPTLDCRAKNGPVQNQIGAGVIEGIAITGPLCANGKAAGSATQQDAEQNMLVPCVFKPSHFTRGKDGAPSEITPPLSADADKGDQESVVLQAFAFHENQRAELSISDTAGSLKCNGGKPGQGYPAVMIGSFQQNSMEGKGSLGYDPDTQVLRPVKPQPDHQMLVLPVAFGGNNTSGPIPVTPAITCNRGNHSGDFEAGTILVETADFQTADSRPEAIAFPERLGSTAYVSQETELAPTLQSVNPTAVAFQERGRDGGRNVETQEEVAYALTSPKGGGRAQERNILTGYAVRRLTPRECDRLQAFPDDWGLIDYKGKPMSDSARYKQLGNAVCVNVAEWVAKRIQMFRTQKPQLPTL
jgi:DNA (cytosine-5)-methyltransferase 1